MTFLLALRSDELADDGPFAPPVPGELEATAPEQELLLAILRQALLDAAGVIPTFAAPTDTPRARIADEARAWLASPEDHPFAFVWVCQALRLAPDYIRARRQDVVRGAKAKYVRRHGRLR